MGKLLSYTREKLNNLQRWAGIRYITVIAVFITFLILAVLVFHQLAMTNAFDAVVQTTENVAAMTESFSDYALDIAKNFCLSIYRDNNVTSLRSDGDLSNIESIILLRQLNNYVTSGDFIDSIYIYNGKKNYIYATVREGNCPELFFDREAASLIMNRQLGQSLDPILRSGTGISTVASVKQIFSFLVFDTDYQGIPADNAIMVNLKPSWYNDLLFENDMSNHVYIVDPHLQVVASRDSSQQLGLDGELALLLVEALEDGEESGYVAPKTLSSGSPIIFFARTGVNNWYYVQVGTYGAMFPYLVSLESALHWVVGISVVVLLFLVMFYILPFLRLRASLSKVAATEIGISTNDVTDKLNRLIELSLDTHRVNESISVMMKEEVLRSFLYGSALEGMAPDNIIREYGMALLPDRPLTILLVTNGTRVSEYLEVVHASWEHAEGVLMNGNHAVLLVQPDGETPFSAVVSTLYSRFGSNRRFVVSTPVESWYDLPQTYRHVRRLALLFCVRSDIYWIDVSRLPAEAPDTDNEIRSRVKTVLGLFRSGTPAEVVSGYKEYMGWVSRLGNESALRGVSQLKSQAEEMLQDLLPEKNSASGHESFDDWLRRLGSPEELDRYFLDLFHQISAVTAGEKEARGLRQAGSVISLINREFRDPALSAQTIADKMGLSYVYLSRAFRQATGSSIAAYINQIRLEESLALLNQPDIRIKSIPAMVGFGNQQYFFVLFKKQYGETPGQYRERILSEPAENAPAEGIAAQ